MARKKYFHKFVYSILILLMLCNLTGCMLLPKEEEARKVSFGRADEIGQYDFIVPERMDLEKAIDIQCTYTQTKEESMSFKVSNLTINKVNVNTGDYVKKGTLLGALDVNDLEQNISELEKSIKQNNLLIEQIRKREDYDKKYVDLEYKYKKITKEERNTRINIIVDNAKANIKSKEDDIYILGLQLKEKKEQLAGSRIYAPIDGCVTFVKGYLFNNLSEEGLCVFKMINPENCVFMIYPREDTSGLKVGQTYTIECEGKSYEGVLKTQKIEGADLLCLYLKKPPLNLQVDTIGVIHLKVENRKNALALPNSVIHYGEGFHLVYVVNKDNVKVMNKVEIGIQTDQYTEIVSGLNDGDQVLNE